MAEGNDPAYLVVKRLELEYTRNGQQISVSATDPDTIDLQEPPAESPERVAELRTDRRGRARLIAFQPGTYQVQTARGKCRQFELSSAPPSEEVTGPWHVRFEPGWGAPNEITLGHLISWSASSDSGVKYFSGSAVYAADVTIPREMKSQGKRLFLDLGRVEVMAEVTLNGKNLGLLWKRPFRLDITEASKAGENHLEVKVTNLWPNRMIGDEQLAEDSERNPNGTLKKWPEWVLEGKPSPTGRFTLTSWRLWQKPSGLLDSGLLGPVRVTAGREF